MRYWFSRSLLVFSDSESRTGEETLGRTLGSCAPRVHVLYWLRGRHLCNFRPHVWNETDWTWALPERSRNVWKPAALLGPASWFSLSSSLCLPCIFPLLQERLFSEVPLPSLAQRGWDTWVRNIPKKKERKLGKRKKSKVIKILGLCSDIRYLQFHSHFSEKYTSQLREAWIQGFTSVAQGFQRLRVGVLSFPLGINVALTSSELSGKDPRRRNLPWPRGYLLSKRNRVLL